MTVLRQNNSQLLERLALTTQQHQEAVQQASLLRQVGSQKRVKTFMRSCHAEMHMLSMHYASAALCILYFVPAAAFLLEYTRY